MNSCGRKEFSPKSMHSLSLGFGSGDGHRSLDDGAGLLQGAGQGVRIPHVCCPSAVGAPEAPPAQPPQQVITYVHMYAYMYCI